MNRIPDLPEGYDITLEDIEIAQNWVKQDFIDRNLPHFLNNYLTNHSNDSNLHIRVRAILVLQILETYPEWEAKLEALYSQIK